MYDIFLGTQVAGQAEVIREGLYYRFSCRCTPPNESVHKILVSDGQNTRDLGICVPTGEWFCLVARVPVKYLSGDNLEFTLMPREQQSTAIPVAADETFDALDKLDQAHLRQIEGKSEIVIDPAPAPQDSDQSQGFQHIWERP